MADRKILVVVVLIVLVLVISSFGEITKSKNHIVGITGRATGLCDDDGQCEDGETCSTCPDDCGACLSTEGCVLIREA